MAASKRAPSYTTPAGEAVWPWINRPDDRPIKGKPQKPAYKLSIRYPAASPAWRELEDKINELVEASYDAAIEANPKKRKLIVRQFPYAMETDDDGEENGNVLLKLKQSAFIKRRDREETEAVYIPKFDALGKPISDKVMVYSGSVVKASFSTRPYLVDSTNGAGVSLDLKAVQVLKLVSSNQRSASAYGFGAEEGYEPIEEEDDTDAIDDVVSLAASVNMHHASDPTDF